MINLLHDILNYEFLLHAFWAGTIAAILAGVVGYFVIIRNLTFAAHAMGHIGFAGASGALLIGLSPILGQLIFTLVAALGMGALGERLSKNDMVIGIVLSFCLGLGSLFLYLYGGYAGQAMIILFGNLFSVSWHDLQIMIWLTLICLGLMAIFARKLLFTSFEPELAEAKGVSLCCMSVIFMLITAAAVTIASQVVGVILVFTLMIGPPAIALRFTAHFWSGLGLSLLLSMLIVWFSLVLSYLTDWPVSFWISGLVFGFYLLSSVRGMN